MTIASPSPLGPEDNDWANARNLAIEHNLCLVEFPEVQIPPNIIDLIPAKIAYQYGIVPLYEDEDGILLVVVSDPTVPGIQNAIAKALHRPVSLCIAPADSLRWAIKEYYGSIR